VLDVGDFIRRIEVDGDEEARAAEEDHEVVSGFEGVVEVGGDEIGAVD